jgi:hypothetical protein
LLLLLLLLCFVAPQVNLLLQTDPNNEQYVNLARDLMTAIELTEKAISHQPSVHVGQPGTSAAGRA